jgi:cGMP-dependent protein kinase
MGCAVSSEQVSDENGINVDSKGVSNAASQGFTQIINEKSPRIRLDHSEKLKELLINGDGYNFKISYCHISQRGYYPNAMGKANQDSYVICESLLGDANSHFFGIFDGHGEYGDSCSYFAANSIPVQLVKELKKQGGMKALDGPKMESIYSDTLVNVNKAMHASRIDDTLSGTTAITVILRGDTLLVANVGDSRAIIASEMEEGLVYSPLSDDQTPFRKDERERVKLRGARVLTLEQIEGNEPIHENWGAESGDQIDEVGDPPRVWDESLERPGCAFTRSLGDSVAEACGVCSEPEILAWKISSFDRYVIIASDGVFEFLTSQAVVDIISKFENVIEGAKYVVAEAYRLWLTYDERTDDISMIVIKIENMKQDMDTPVMISRAMSSFDVSSRQMQIKESKPVRRAMSQAKRKLISETWDKEESQKFDLEVEVTLKSPEDIARITTMVQVNIHIYIHIYIYKYIHTLVTFIYTYICMYVFIYICIYIYRPILCSNI